ncbi:MAG: hypothetical protein KatS3mg094_320 [Candidatus Parcubacteria bacterium]|nr:MAG: hypothetical protein KatS3mg094_320 [Candidatus Parcubacteria bacterium]
MENYKLLTILPEDLETDDYILNEEEKEINNNFILIYLIKNQNEISINYQKPIDFSKDKNQETIIRTDNGNYKLKVFSIKGNLIEETTFNPSNEANFEIIAIPNYSNFGYVELENLLENKKEELDLSPISVCNENNICEAGEEEKCPLDCPNIKNINYPQTTFIQQDTDNISTQSISTITPPQNYFFQIIILTALSLLTIALLSFIIIKKLRK